MSLPTEGASSPAYWVGLHRHLALVRLAYRWLARQRLTAAAALLPPGGAFPPSGRRPSLPAVHRQVLL